MDWAPVQQVLNAMLAALSTLLVAAAFSLARTYIRRLCDERLRRFLLELVEAAEQIYGPGRGAEKRAWVNEQLRARGYDLERAQLEAAVYGLNERQRWQDTGVTDP